MKIDEMLRRLHGIRFLMEPNDVKNCEVSIETRGDEGRLYYEGDFDFFVDDNNDIGISPVNS